MLRGGGFLEVEDCDRDDGAGALGVVPADGEFGCGVGLEVVEGFGGRWAEDP